MADLTKLFPHASKSFLKLHGLGPIKYQESRLVLAIGKDVTETSPKPSKARKAQKKALPDAFSDLCETWFRWRPIPEFRFDRKRRWRFDYAWPEQKVALEVEGGVWIQGRHTRGSGFVKDMEKYNRAASLGWLVLKVQPKDLKTPATGNLVLTALNAHSFTAFWRTQFLTTPCPK